MKFKIRLFVVLFSIFISELYAQQDPHYTQYMCNTMSVNPAYTGSRGYGFISAIARTQWLGLDGAPNTQSLSFDTPIGKGLGVGINVLNDALGPSREFFLEGNVSYTIEMAKGKKIAFGLRLGGRMLDIDWSKGKYYQEFDPVYKENFHKILPTVGSGIYYYAPQKWYMGFAVPNLLRNESYNQETSKIEVAPTDKMHLYMILGYVFSINNDIKLKPASLIKAAYGAPLSVDFSMNFYFYDKVNAGLSWRWGDSISTLLGLQVTNSLLVGYSYDLTTSNFRVSNIGTHELVLQYQFLNGSGGTKLIGCF